MGLMAFLWMKQHKSRLTTSHTAVPNKHTLLRLREAFMEWACLRFLRMDALHTEATWQLEWQQCQAMRQRQGSCWLSAGTGRKRARKWFRCPRLLMLSLAVSARCCYCRCCCGSPKTALSFRRGSDRSTLLLQIPCSLVSTGQAGPRAVPRAGLGMEFAGEDP